LAATERHPLYGSGTPAMKRTYDEDLELTNYIWHHYSRFLNAIEARASRAWFAEEKAKVGYAAFAAGLREKFKLEEDPEVVAILADGIDAYRVRATRRILQTYASEVLINRCPRCSRIANTPKAQQCFWCSYDWHPIAASRAAI
jgi:hypothetical protein